MTMATTMLLLKGLKEQGRLGRSFGRVVIRDQPSSNTIQKIIAVKDAMAYIENYLQNLNIVLLKIRTILLSGQPEVCYGHFHSCVIASGLKHFACIELV